MIQFKCPECQALNEMPVINGCDLMTGRKTICIACGMRLGLVLVVMTQEAMLRTLLRRKNEKDNDRAAAGRDAGGVQRAGSPEDAQATD